MKKIIYCLIVFFVAVAVVDVLFGMACRYLNSNAKGGDTANHHYITMTQTEPVIIMGSSRAIHHYKPNIMEDSLGLGVYNCGLDGNGILFQYGRLELLLERYRPKIIIYDVYPIFDIYGSDVVRDLGWLRRWYGHESLDSLFVDISPSEKYKLKSNLYRYNGSFIQMISDNINPIQTVTYKGYKPLYGIVDYEPDSDDDPVVEWNPLKLMYFRKFIDLCSRNDIKLVVVYSPNLGKKESTSFNCLTELCKTYDIPVIDYYGGGEFNDSTKFFKDATHLNDEGAEAFTRSIIRHIKPVIYSAN